MNPEMAYSYWALTADRLAQLVVHWTRVGGFAGSTPTGPTLRVLNS